MLSPESVRATLCITYAGRSGSFLLSNLLDNHPEILAVPPHAGTYLMSGLVEALSVPDAKSSAAALADAICAKNPYLLSTTDHTPLLGKAAAQMKVGVDRDRFHGYLALLISRLAQGGTGTFQNIFNAVHIAYAMAKGRAIATPSPIIAWQKHFSEPHEKTFIVQNFRDLHFLISLRNPEVSLSAHIDAYLYERPPGTEPMSTLATRLLMQFIGGTRIVAEPERTLAVRFEDVHARTEEVMRALVRHFGLRWDPVLLQTTVDGETAYFNKHGRLITGTNPDVAKVTKTKSFNWLDRWRLRYAMARDYERWNYRRPFASVADLLFRPAWLRRLLFSVPTKMQLRIYVAAMKQLWQAFREENARISTILLAQAEAAESRPVGLLPLDPDATAGGAAVGPQGVEPAREVTVGADPGIASSTARVS